MIAAGIEQHGRDRGYAAQRHPHPGRRQAVAAEGGTSAPFLILILIIGRGGEVGHDRKASGRHPGASRPGERVQDDIRAVRDVPSRLRASLGGLGEHRKHKVADRPRYVPR